MIDMNTIDKLYDFIRCKDWSAAHAMLDEIELADPKQLGRSPGSAGVAVEV